MHNIEAILVLQSVTVSKKGVAINANCMLLFDIKFKFNSARLSTSNSNLEDTLDRVLNS
jgi:hypothetical protein